MAHFASAESKELLTQNSISSENILRNEREIKTVSAEEKLREVIASRPKRMAKSLYIENKRRNHEMSGGKKENSKQNHRQMQLIFFS